MQTSKNKYDARIMNALAHNNIRLQSIKDIVEEAILNSETPLKKSELDSIVSLKIDLPIDKSIVGAVATSLTNLFKKRIVKQANIYGYWEKY